jgi:hypothetical protein
VNVICQFSASFDSWRASDGRRLVATKTASDGTNHSTPPKWAMVAHSLSSVDENNRACG